MTHQRFSAKAVLTSLILLSADSALAIDWRALGREALHDFKAAFSSGSKSAGANKQHLDVPLKVQGNEAVAIGAPPGGRTAQIAHGEVQPGDRSIIQTVIEAPELMTEASSIRPELNLFRDAKGGSFGLTREFGTGERKNKITHTFRDERIEGKLVRVQTHETYETSHMRSTATLHGDELRLFLETKGVTPVQRLQLIKPAPLEAEGRLIRFKFAGDGKSLSLFILKDGQVTEHTYVVEVSGLKSYSDGAKHMDLTSSGRKPKKLNEEEVAKHGFFKVTVTILPGRKDAAGAAAGARRGVHVEDSGVGGRQ